MFVTNPNTLGFKNNFQYLIAFGNIAKLLNTKCFQI